MMCLRLTLFRGPAHQTEQHILGVRHDGHGFRSLWRKVRTHDQPEEVSYRRRVSTAVV